MQESAGSLVFSRRSLLCKSSIGASLILATGACGRKRGRRYQGWLTAASMPEKAVTVANLASFQPVMKRQLPHAPASLFRAGKRIFAVCPEGAELIALDPGAGFGIAGRLQLPAPPVAARPVSAETALVLTGQAAILVDLSRQTILSRATLPGVPGDFDLSGGIAALSMPGRNSVVRVSVPAMEFLGETAIEVSPGAIRFRKDAKTILVGAPAARQVITLDSASGALLTRLSVPIAPERFCFNPDGGQMFVSGAGADAICIVNPYQNEVDQTILAGRMPGAMAVSDRRNLLFIGNPAGGDITILDIDTRSLCTSVHVGGEPGEIVVTPDNEYALAIDGKTGNVSVLRVDSAPQPTSPRRTAGVTPLFTTFSTASGAQSALIVPFDI